MISDCSVSLIMCAGGAYRPFAHDRHINEASSLRRAAGTLLATVALDHKPAEPGQQGWPGKTGERKN
jgi:hypothetical protein